MKEQLIQYVELLFAGAPNSTEIKQEILQNTLDRYDDLLSQGKTPEAAYRLAISGIGDINEILEGGQENVYQAEAVSYSPVEQPRGERENRLRRAVAVAFYILCPVPLFILGDVGSGVMGLCLMFLLIAAATVLIMISRDPEEENRKNASGREAYQGPRQELRKSIGTLIWVVGLALYFILSFSTHAWYITWLVFPITSCVRGLVNACIDLKEACDHEN